MMHAFGLPGIVELVVLLGFSGGAGFPLGIPPAPEDPLLAKVAPEECLFYTTWSGVAEPDAASDNQTEQLLAEPEVRQMIDQIVSRVESGLRAAAAREDPGALQLVDDAVHWGKTLLTHPTVVFVSSVEIDHTGPQVQAGALVRVGEDVDKLKTSLQMYQQMFLAGAAQPVDIGGETWYRINLDPKAPEITWGVKGNYLIVGIGQDAVEGILDRARTDPPKWLSELREQLAVDRVATITYINVGTVIDTVSPLAGPEGGIRIQAALAATGLGDVTSLASVTGLDKQGFVNRTLLGLGGQPQGLLSFAAAEPLTPDDLAPIPRDATIAMAARIDAATVVETVLAAMEKIDPRARQEATEGLEQIRKTLGFDLRTEVLEALGDSWCVYNSPGEGGLVVTGLTAVVEVKNRQSLTGVQTKLMAVAAAQMLRGANPRRGPRIEQFEFAGQQVFFFNARDNDFPLAPAWCLTDDALIVATFPQNIKAYLSRDSDFESLATSPAVAELFASGAGPVALSYADTNKLFELVYPFAPMLAQVAMSELQREGIDVNVSILPSAGAIGKHLRPTVSAVRRHPGGIELIARQTLPGGNVGTTAPVAVSLMLPAVQSARDAARRAQGMNNLKQIALAMHNYHDLHKSFPAAYIADADGKPLLSWRVLILPFVEEQALYNQFHLDEPWDSPHNKQFIQAMPAVYRAPASRAAPGQTNYLTVRGPDTVFPGAEKISMADIRDGSSNTIMVVEAGDVLAVPWTKPDDFTYDKDNPLSGLIGLHHNGFSAAFSDGSVRLLRGGIDIETLNALFTRGGGEVVRHGEF
ncbi:MAG: DUF1559 domain-containing protein [Pirellulales bacterium]|nr:DUF1559 domain-containing protein [Pirellulales bacterium]